MKNNHKIWRFLFKFHRYTGLSSAIVLLMLAITGIALNHTDELKLDTQMIESESILNWYGIQTSSNLTSFPTQTHWLSQSGQQIYFGHASLRKTENILIGAIETNDFIVTAFNNYLLLLTSEGETIEQIPIDKLEKIGINSLHQVIIQSKQLTLFSDDDLISWQPYTKRDISWSKPMPLPTLIANKIKKIARSNILPLERVLLDLHSGRFFGNMGVIIVDITGVLLVLLVLSGCTIWLKHKLRSFRSSRRRYRKHH
jgi:hypothetical protein